MEEKQGKEPKFDIVKVLESDDVPNFYANSFAIFQGNADMGVAFLRNGKPTAVMNLSFTLAKTLSEKLGRMVADFEKVTKTEIMTTNVVDSRTQPTPQKAPSKKQK